VRNLSFYFLLSILPFIAVSQKGFQFGLGLNQITTKSETTINRYEVKTSNLYGASLNIDYSFSNKFRIKSGLEYKSQNIDFGNFIYERAEYISIPIIFNYNFLQLEKSGLSFGIDVGFSFDKPAIQSVPIIFSSIDEDKKTITTLEFDIDGLPSRIFEFSDYGSLRYGITATYNIGKRGQLNFFAHSSTFLFAWGFPLRVNEQVLIDGQEISNISNLFNLDISSTGIQFGLYYTFGTLTFK